MQPDVPYLPELPRRPEDLMVPSALREFTGLEPAFLEALQVRAPRCAKVQLAGPATVAAFSSTSGDVVAHLANRAAQLARALRQAGVTPMLFLDEPGLGKGGFPVAALERVRLAAQQEGAIVGLHCCAQTRWAEVLGLGFDLISLDARLSLDALLEDRRAWLRFLKGGGTLCLGIIPTEPGARYDVAELCDSVEASLRATTPRFEEALCRMLLSPACGLALHPVAAAERISREVRLAQARLRALL